MSVNKTQIKIKWLPHFRVERRINGVKVSNSLPNPFDIDILKVSRRKK